MSAGRPPVAPASRAEVHGDARREKRLEWRMMLAVFLVTTFVFSISPVITNYDSYSAFPTAVSMVNRQTLSLDAYAHVNVVANSYTVGRANGQLLTNYPWPVALFATPAVVVLDLAHVVGGPSADSIVAHHPQIGSLVQLWSASIVTGLTCTELALLAYRRLRGPARSRRRWAFASGLVFAFTTAAWSTASRSLWQHGPSILFLSLGLLALDRIFPRKDHDEQAATAAASGVGAALLAGFAFAVALTMRPTNAVALFLAGLVVLWKRPAKDLGAFLGGALVVMVPWIVATYASYDRLFQPYDQANKLGFPSTFFESVAANLVSPSRGLLVFSPIVLSAVAGLVVASRRRGVGPLEVMSTVAVVAYIIGNGLFPIWWAGNSFGPRFLTETLPFLFLLAIPFVDWLRAWNAERPDRRSRTYRVVAAGTAALVAFSLVVNAQGGLLRSSSCWNGTAHTAQNVDNDPSRVWSWGDAQFDYGLRALGSEGLHAVTRCPAST